MALLGEYPQGYWEGNQFVLPTIAPLQQTVPPIPVAAAAPPVSPLLRVKPLLEQPADGGDWIDPSGTPQTDRTFYATPTPSDLHPGPFVDWPTQSRPFSGTPYTKSWMPSILSTGGSLLGGSMGGLLGAGIGSAIDVYGADKLLGPYAYGYSPTGLSWGDAFVDATPLGWFGMGKSVPEQISDIFSYRGDDPHQLIQDPSYDAILGSLYQQARAGYEAPPWVDPDIGGLDIGGEGVSYGGDDLGLEGGYGDISGVDVGWT